MIHFLCKKLNYFWGQPLVYRQEQRLVLSFCRNLGILHAHMILLPLVWGGDRREGGLEVSYHVWPKHVMCSVWSSE